MSTDYQIHVDSTGNQWTSDRIKEKIKHAGGTVWLEACDLPGGWNVEVGT